MHALRAYTDLPAKAEATGFSGMTINLVPSLSAQLLDLGNRHVLDRHFHVAQQIAQGDPDAIASAFEQHAIQTPRPLHELPRFSELQQMRGAKHVPSSTDAIDACVLFHLAWMGFTHGANPDIQDLFQKGRHYSAEDLMFLLNYSADVCSAVLPRLRRLQEQGLIHLTATPLTHPILPLLIDTQCAKEATHDSGAPRPFSAPDMAKRQVRRAIEEHKAHFGKAPQSMWPAEGSLSEEAMAMFGECGVTCVASDEQLLRASLQTSDKDAHLHPYRHTSSNVGILFRDRELSDAWGFRYRNMSPMDALTEFQSGLHHRRASGATCTSIILDGENPFEFYANAGDAHLEALSKLDRSAFRLIAPHEASDPRPLDHVKPGSWINASFDIWAGDEEDRKAWDLLAKVHEKIDLEKLSDERRSACLDHLLAAESSDWFWWYGPEFENPHRAGFDALFRGHLLGALSAAGIEDIEEFSLHEPIIESVVQKAVQTPIPFAIRAPQTSINHSAEWINALRVTAQKDAGAMHQGHHFLRWVDVMACPSGIAFRIQADADMSEVWCVIETEGEHVRLECTPMKDNQAGLFAALWSFPLSTKAGGNHIKFRAMGKHPHVKNEAVVNTLPSSESAAVALSLDLVDYLEA